MSKALYPRWNPVTGSEDMLTWEELTAQEKRSYAKATNFGAPGGFSGATADDLWRMVWEDAEYDQKLRNVYAEVGATVKLMKLRAML